MSFKKIFISVSVLFSLLITGTFAQTVIGDVVYKEGSVELMRNGEVYQEDEFNIGDEIENEDLITTHRDGLLEAEINAEDSPQTTVKIAPNTVFVFEISKVKGKSDTAIGIITGSLKAKVNKLKPSQSFRVTSDTAVLGVRGTTFNVTAPPSGDILVTCEEGSVLCTDDEGNSAIAKPGTVVEKKVGEMFREIPVSVSSLADFRRDWYAERIEVLKANALKAIRDFSKRYYRLYDQFNEEYRALISEREVINKWINEDRNHKIGSRMEVMREKKRIIGHIFKLRRILFIFERIYFRLAELNEYYRQGYGRGMIDSNTSSADFFKSFNAQKRELSRKMSMVRYVLKLYAKRNGGFVPTSAFSQGFSSDEESDKSFFGNDDDFGNDSGDDSDF